MSILINKNTKIIVQGITGSEGSFHSEQMIQYSSNIVAGVTPGKGNQTALSANVPVFNSVKEAKSATKANASIIFVPPRFAADAIIESILANIEIIVCITEGIPIQDMLTVKHLLNKSNTIMIGPNCPGVITVDECKMGIMPNFICKKGSIGVVSRSGTLTYEAIDQLVKEGLGQTTAVGIGGDSIPGTSMKDILSLFENDPQTEGIVMIGEIGGESELVAAKWAKENMTKPIVAYIAGKTAPKGKRMGHAGAIISGGNDTAESKIEAIKSLGIAVSDSVADIGTTMKNVLKKEKINI